MRRQAGFPFHPSDRRHVVRALALASLLAGALACGTLITPQTPTPNPTTLSVFQPTTSTPSPTPSTTPGTTPIVIPTPAPTNTPLPTATPETAWLPGEVRVFPGPLHYTGDVLSIEVVVENVGRLPEKKTATLLIDDQALPTAPFVIYSPLRDHVLIFRWAWEADRAGLHALVVQVPIDEAGTVQEIKTFVEVLPGDQRPAQERDAQWEQVHTACCRIAYISHTAAARDIDQIAPQINESVTAIENQFGLILSDKPIPITLIDNAWGNGAYAGDELVLVYVDRAFAGFDLGTVARHEATHWAARMISQRTPMLLVEGIAVYVAGGHYKPEPIPERAAALLALDRYIPLRDLANTYRARQHEVAYIEAAGLVAYLTETYGWNRFITLYATQIDARDARWLDEALQQVYRLNLDQVEQDYIAWLESHPSDGQIDDLRLTIDLYETIRRYEALYAPYQEQLPPIQDAIDQALVAEFMREPTAPENLALETMLVAVNRALLDGRTTSAAELLAAINATLDDADFTRQPVSDYLAIAQALSARGYEAQRINIAASTATVLAIHTWPQLETLTLERIGDQWQIVDGK